MPELQDFIDGYGLWLYPKFQLAMKDTLQKAMPDWEFGGWRSEYKGKPSPKRSLFEVYPYDTSAPGVVGLQIMEDSIRLEARDSPIGSPQMKYMDPETPLDQIAKEVKTMLQYDQKQASRKKSAAYMASGYLKKLHYYQKELGKKYRDLDSLLEKLGQELQMPVDPENKNEVIRSMNKIVEISSPTLLQDLNAETKDQLAAIRHHFETNPVEAGMRRDAGFMEAQIWEGDFYTIDGNDGSISIEADLIGELDKKLEDLTEEELAGIFGEYYEGSRIFNVEFEHGWGAMLSAPGYMDQTDLTVFPSEAEAKDYLMETYDLDENLEEPEDMGS